MSGNMAYAAGFVVGLLCVAAGCLLLRAVRKKKGEEACQFDERQEAARGKAFKAGFFTLMGYEIIVGLAALLMETELFADSFAHAIVGITIAITVFATKCILNDAYYALNENRKWSVILFAVVAVMNGTSGISTLCNGKDELIANGKLTHMVSSLAVTVMCVVLVIVTLIKNKQDRQEAEE